ncbi:hypothetical protein [Chryseobacterium sp. ERMR1:04]|uniref:hypothetical protein n=1 Tax=Chryseobacterium sp. ERMR1:04 TaxID=1705393 RepID=UPI0006C8CB9F|nr:hypothetical protein [Chryseobacterium sp. ERMR1:04]KPH14667.1 hypothetical protein AMQ68_04215 [Chryseobacterium sp. ERMR1:04]
MREVFLIMILFVLSSCDGQNKKNLSSDKIDTLNNPLKKDTMERFNLYKYKNLPTDDMGFYKMTNGDLVQLIEKSDKHGYAERINLNGSSLGVYKEYDMSNILIKTGDFFYQTNVGKWKEFNEKGNLIKEIDYEKPYKFAINDLIEKIKKEYQINLEDKSEGSAAGRTLKDGVFYYEVFLKYKTGEQKMEYLLIDGTTGKTVLKSDYHVIK